LDVFKKNRKSALDIIEVLFKDESIAIDIFPQLNFFLDFSRAVTSLAKKSSQKIDPSWICFCCEFV